MFVNGPMVARMSQEFAAKQRAKELATTGTSRIKDSQSPTKAKRLASIRSSGVLREDIQEGGVRKSAGSGEMRSLSSLYGKKLLEATEKVDEAITSLKNEWKELDLKKNLNLQLAEERYVETDVKSSPVANKLGKQIFFCIYHEYFS
jgi:hypothetical protein